MSIRKPDLGPAGHAQLDEPVEPPGLAPADRASLAHDERWPTHEEPAEQPTAGGKQQPLAPNRPPVSGGTDPDDEHVIGDPDRVDDRREEDNGGFSKA